MSDVGIRDKVTGIGGRIARKFEHIRRTDELSTVLGLALYFAGNIVYAIYLLVVWYDKVLAAEDDPAQQSIRVSRWAPIAKMAGGLLNLNCAVLLVRSMLATTMQSDLIAGPGATRAHALSQQRKSAPNTDPSSLCSIAKEYRVPQAGCCCGVCVRCGARDRPRTELRRPGRCTSTDHSIGATVINKLICGGIVSGIHGTISESIGQAMVRPCQVRAHVDRSRDYHGNVLHIHGWTQFVRT